MSLVMLVWFIACLSLIAPLIILTGRSITAISPLIDTKCAQCSQRFANRLLLRQHRKRRCGVVEEARLHPQPASILFQPASILFR
ncbi:hypothetical protein V8C86DRAFT_2573360 [Haematococcus lacustris]